MFRMNKVAATLACIALSGHLYAAEPYDVTKSYSGGTQVTLNGQTYEAKWWTNAGQSPTDNYANEWDSPWKLVSGSTPTPDPDPTPDPNPTPD
ncbi:carbohydrate-binding protein, partial [Vibrio sp. 10N.261.55.A7]|uniref:carbohydrate-binding protein n=1 Tax=Vibrio sp. 10N.261.55.A7 TaxID=1880851 RepID=UPI001F537EC8